MPHCAPPHSRNAFCNGCNSASHARPSTVSIHEPSAWSTGTMQLFTSSPSKRTEHEPHSPSPQPSLVPVRRKSSRSTSSRRFIGGTHTVCEAPFTRKSIEVQGALIQALAPPLEKAL